MCGFLYVCVNKNIGDEAMFLKTLKQRLEIAVIKSGKKMFLNQIRILIDTS